MASASVVAAGASVLAAAGAVGMWKSKEHSANGKVMGLSGRAHRPDGQPVLQGQLACDGRPGHAVLTGELLCVGTEEQQLPKLVLGGAKVLANNKELLVTPHAAPSPVTLSFEDPKEAKKWEQELRKVAREHASPEATLVAYASRVSDMEQELITAKEEADLCRIKMEELEGALKGTGGEEGETAIKYFKQRERDLTKENNRLAHELEELKHHNATLLVELQTVSVHEGVATTAKARDMVVNMRDRVKVLSEKHDATMSAMAPMPPPDSFEGIPRQDAFWTACLYRDRGPAEGRFFPEASGPPPALMPAASTLLQQNAELKKKCEDMLAEKVKMESAILPDEFLRRLEHAEMAQRSAEEAATFCQNQMAEYERRPDKTVPLQQKIDQLTRQLEAVTNQYDDLKDAVGGDKMVDDIQQRIDQVKHEKDLHIADLTSRLQHIEGEEARATVDQRMIELQKACDNATTYADKLERRLAQMEAKEKEMHNQLKAQAARVESKLDSHVAGATPRSRSLSVEEEPLLALHPEVEQKMQAAEQTRAELEARVKGLEDKMPSSETRMLLSDMQQKKEAAEAQSKASEQRRAQVEAQLQDHQRQAQFHGSNVQKLEAENSTLRTEVANIRAAKEREVSHWRAEAELQSEKAQRAEAARQAQTQFEQTAEMEVVRQESMNKQAKLELLQKENSYLQEQQNELSRQADIKVQEVLQSTQQQMEMLQQQNLQLRQEVQEAHQARAAQAAETTAHVDRVAAQAAELEEFRAYAAQVDGNAAEVEVLRSQLAAAQHAQQEIEVHNARFQEAQDAIARLEAANNELNVEKHSNAKAYTEGAVKMQQEHAAAAEVMKKKIAEHEYQSSLLKKTVEQEQREHHELKARHRELQVHVQDQATLKGVSQQEHQELHSRYTQVQQQLESLQAQHTASTESARQQTQMLSSKLAAAVEESKASKEESEGYASQLGRMQDEHRILQQQLQDARSQVQATPNLQGHMEVHGNHHLVQELATENKQLRERIAEVMGQISREQRHASQERLDAGIFVHTDVPASPGADTMFGHNPGSLKASPKVLHVQSVVQQPPASPSTVMPAGINPAPLPMSAGTKLQLKAGHPSEPAVGKSTVPGSRLGPGVQQYAARPASNAPRVSNLRPPSTTTGVRPLPLHQPVLRQHGNSPRGGASIPGTAPSSLARQQPVRR